MGRSLVTLLLLFRYSFLVAVELDRKAFRICFAKNERLNTTHFRLSGKGNITKYYIASDLREITIAAFDWIVL